VGLIIIVCLNGDTDDSGATDLNDLTNVISDWGAVNSDNDLNASGAVDISDLIEVLQHVGIAPIPSP
jgi:hypothetical protein